MTTFKRVRNSKNCTHIIYIGIPTYNIRDFFCRFSCLQRYKMVFLVVTSLHSVYIPVYRYYLPIYILYYYIELRSEVIVVYHMDFPTKLMSCSSSRKIEKQHGHPK